MVQLAVAAAAKAAVRASHTLPGCPLQHRAASKSSSGSSNSREAAGATTGHIHCPAAAAVAGHLLHQQHGRRQQLQSVLLLPMGALGLRV